MFEHFRVQDLLDPAFSDYYAHLKKEDIDAVIDQALRFCNEMTGPINSSADSAGCVLKDGRVITPKGFKEAWKKLYELGLPNFMVELEEGGFQGPQSVNVMLGELQSGANTSFMMYPALTHGALELIETFALPAEKKKFVEPMLNGRFSGTMCLSEPHAGSDVGAAKTRARHLERHTYKIYGTKYWMCGRENFWTLSLE